MGWRNCFSSCAVVSGFRLWLEIVLGVTYLPYQLCRCVFFLVLAGNSFGLHRSVFWLWQENGFTCYLLTYHTSCAIVSVFWLRREIVFGCTVSKKDSYLVSLIKRESASKCVYFVRSNTLLLCISLLCIYLLYRTDQGHVWPSGWVMRKVANGPGFEHSAKGGVSSKRA
jgi:hypothetical protein